MARVTVYVPDALAEQVRAAGINVSAIAQCVLRDGVAAADVNRWLDRLPDRESQTDMHDQVMAALDAARDEFGG